MSKTSGRDGLSEAFQDLLANVAKGLLLLGGLATLIAVAMLIIICVRVAGDASIAAQAAKNIPILKEVLLYGAIGVAVGSSYLFWGEEIGPLILLGGAAVLFFAPMWMGFIVGDHVTDATTQAVEALRSGGSVIGVVAAIVLVVDVAQKTRQRAKVGIKADQLKYGKGVKEEKDRQNVFLGKCFQLPYCRKFVRERCPIYHARRTCWKERVGCMCEEEVIRKAMEGKPISKDQILDGSNIPRNHRLNEKQKAERCRNCVIYNEHQRQKYKAVVPAVVIGFGLVYLLGHGPLTEAIEHFVTTVDALTHKLVVSNGKSDIPQVFIEGLLFFTMLLALTYSMKLVEYLVFKLKI